MSDYIYSAQQQAKKPQVTSTTNNITPKNDQEKLDQKNANAQANKSNQTSATTANNNATPTDGTLKDRDLGENYDATEETKLQQLRDRSAKSYKIGNLQNDLHSMRRDKATRKVLEQYAVKSAIYGIGGMPATFLDNTDPPLHIANNTPNALGYQYINSVIRYGTFVAFQPGYITWNISNNVNLDNILSKETIDYFTTKVIGGGLDFNQPKLKEYHLEVARHARMAILLMGIENMGLNAAFIGSNAKSAPYGSGLNVGSVGEKALSFKSFQHRDLANLGLGLADSVISGIPSMAYDESEGERSSGFVVFYVDGPIEASDSFTNNAEPSPLKSTLMENLGDTHSAIKNAMGKTLGAWDGTNTLVTFLAGNPIIPDVPKDSTYSKSYSMNMIFSSASGDPVSVFMNCIYPLIKLMCLAVPLGTGGFYASAPVLRVFSQGVINTEYGLIESMNISRKMETMNDWGMPTEIVVNVIVRDLNPYLYREMPGWFSSGMTIGSSMNTFLATICGVNVTTLNRTQKMNINARMKEEYYKTEGSFKNIIDRKFQGWSDIATNWMYDVGEKVQTIRIGTSRLFQLANELPRDVGTRVGSIGSTATGAVDKTSSAISNGWSRGSSKLSK